MGKIGGRQGERESDGRGRPIKRKGETETGRVKICGGRRLKEKLRDGGKERRREKNNERRERWQREGRGK